MSLWTCCHDPTLSAGQSSQTCLVTARVTGLIPWQAYCEADLAWLRHGWFYYYAVYQYYSIYFYFWHADFWHLYLVVASALLPKHSFYKKASGQVQSCYVCFVMFLFVLSAGVVVVGVVVQCFGYLAFMVINTVCSAGSCLHWFRLLRNPPFWPLSINSCGMFRIGAVEVTGKPPLQLETGPSWAWLRVEGSERRRWQTGRKAFLNQCCVTLASSSIY